MSRVLAGMLALSIAACSFMRTQGPPAPDRAGDCTTSYSPVRTDWWISRYLMAPLAVVALFAGIDALVSGVDESDNPREFDGDKYVPWVIGTSIPFVIGIPFAASEYVGDNRVDACRKARGMLNDEQEVAAWEKLSAERDAEVQRRIEACKATPPPGTAALVTSTGPDIEISTCTVTGQVAVRGQGRLRQLRDSSCAVVNGMLVDPNCPDVEVGDFGKALIARVPGVPIEWNWPHGLREACPFAAQGDVMISFTVGDWAQVDAVIAAARAELAKWNLGWSIVVGLAIAPVCSHALIDATVPPLPERPRS